MVSREVPGDPSRRAAELAARSAASAAAEEPQSPGRSGSGAAAAAAEAKRLNPQWVSVPALDGSSPLYFNAMSGVISTTPVEAPELPVGGILADEMGEHRTCRPVLSAWE